MGLVSEIREFTFIRGLVLVAIEIGRSPTRLNADDMQVGKLLCEGIHHLQVRGLGDRIGTRTGRRCEMSHGGRDADQHSFGGRDLGECLDPVECRAHVEVESLHELLDVVVGQTTHRRHVTGVGDEDVDLADLARNGLEGRVDLCAVREIDLSTEDSCALLCLRGDFTGALLQFVRSAAENGHGFGARLGECCRDRFADSSAAPCDHDVLPLGGEFRAQRGD